MGNNKYFKVIKGENKKEKADRDVCVTMVLKENVHESGGTKDCFDMEPW